MGAVRVWGKPLTYEPRDTPSLHWLGFAATCGKLEASTGRQWGKP